MKGRNEVLVGGLMIVATLIGVLGTLWFIASGVLVFWRTLFRCPCCKKHFYTRVLSGNAFARSCVHCGLPNWAPGPDGR